MFWTSIRNKLIVLLLLITVIPFGSSIYITYAYTKESIKDQFIQENMNLLYQGKINIESYLTELDQLTRSVYNNPDFNSFLKAPYKDTDYISFGVVKNVLSTLLYTDENIEQVYLYLPYESKLIFASRRSSVLARSVDLPNESYYEGAKYSRSHLYIEPNHHVRNYGIIPERRASQKEVFSMHRALVNIPGNDVLGYLSLDTSLERILDMSDNLYNRETEDLFVIDPAGKIIYGSQLLNHRDVIEEEWFVQLREIGERNGFLEWSDEQFSGVIMYDQIDESTGGWILVKRIPYDTLYKGARDITKINITIGIFTLFLVVLATFFVSFKITSPIRVLLRNIQRIEAGNLEVDFESLGNDEIGILGKRFKSMIEKINHLIINEYKMEIENKNNQLRVLQSQINPHFLYNSLQSIGTLALKHNVPKVYSLLTHLSRIMRYGMNMEEDLVPVVKEIHHARAYLQLQKQRFDDHLEFGFDVDESIHSAKVPKMILQPIIENYFKHGFDARDEMGYIHIKIEKQESTLRVIVSDNGKGVTEKKLALIRLHLENSIKLSEGDENIGLKNVYDRLKLYYGDDVVFCVGNRDSGGFMVTMEIPIYFKDVK